MTGVLRCIDDFEVERTQTTELKQHVYLCSLVFCSQDLVVSQPSLIIKRGQLNSTHRHNKVVGKSSEIFIYRN